MTKTGRFSHIRPFLRLKHALGEALLPRLCELCHGACERNIGSSSTIHNTIHSTIHSTRGDALCSNCRQNLSPNTLYSRCQQCDLPLAVNAAYCGECLELKPHFDRIIGAYIFRHPIDTLINRFKHQKGHYTAAQLVPELVTRIATEYTSLPDIIIPVPIHWRKRILRGYNQSDILANELSQALKIPWRRLIQKTKSTALQQGLNRKQRKSNLKKSFSCNKKSRHMLSTINHVVLVDDVVTTGATVDELAKLLKKMGVKKVDVWALARTPK